MKLLANTIFLASSLFALSLQCNQTIIRHATPGDLPRLIELSQNVINEYFRNTIITGYPDSPIAQNPELLREYLDSFIDAFNTAFECILNSNHNKDLYLLVAVDEQHPTELLGLCFAEKRDGQAYVRYIAVDGNYHKKGIGSQLLNTIINLFDDVDSCALKTFSHANENVHAFYEKNGFTSNKAIVTLANKRTDYSDTITFICYNLDLKK